MRVFGRLESGFWDNSKVRELTDHEKLLLTYLFSCKHGNAIGCFVLPIEYIAADLGWTIEVASERIAALADHAFVSRDQRTNVTKVRGWWGHNALDTPNHAKNAVKSALLLPGCALKEEAIAELRNLSDELSPNAAEALRDGLQMASASHSDGIPTTETETETKTQTKKQTQTLAPRGAARKPAGEFDEWYNAYPRHVGKGAAHEKYRAARKKTDHAILLAGAKRAAKQYFNTEQRYIPYPATWLNEERWLDEEPKRGRVMSEEERNAYSGVR